MTYICRTNIEKHIIMKSQTTTNGTTYTTHEIKIEKTVYSVTIATGRFNYVSIRKETANPWKTLGKQFADFDEAVRNYKNPTMKMELLKLEVGL